MVPVSIFYWIMSVSQAGPYIALSNGVTKKRIDLIRKEQSWLGVRCPINICTGHKMAPSLSLFTWRKEENSNDWKIKEEVEGRAVYFPHAQCLICFIPWDSASHPSHVLTVSGPWLMSLHMHLVGMGKTARILWSSVSMKRSKSGKALPPFQKTSRRGKVQEWESSTPFWRNVWCRAKLRKNWRANSL